MKEHIKRVDRILKYKGSILDIYTDVIETPDGHRAEWDYIDHRGAAAVVPVLDDGCLLMVRQYRDALDRETIEVGKPIQCQVAVNHIVELTAEEKAEARQQAVRRYQDEELRKLQNRTKPTKAKTETQVQPSLFDFGL